MAGGSNRMRAAEHPVGHEAQRTLEVRGPALDEVLERLPTTVASGAVDAAASSRSSQASPPKASNGTDRSAQAGRSRSNGSSQARRPPSSRTTHHVDPVQIGVGPEPVGLAARSGLEPLGEPLGDRAQAEELGVGVGEKQDHRPPPRR